MNEVGAKIEEIIKRLFGIETKVEMRPAPEGSGADFATNAAMKLAKDVHEAPISIAEKIVNEVNLDDFEVSIAGSGFINFKSSDAYFLGLLDENREYTDIFSRNISPDGLKDKNVVVEFSDPNPFKVLHVGHLYTSIVGDAMARLIERAGAKVARVNFGGDVGLHVAKTIWALKNAGVSVDNLTIEEIAKNYVIGSQRYEEDEDAKNEIIELNKVIYDKFPNAENEKNIYEKGRELSYQYFKDFYKKIGVNFDKFYPESEVVETGVEKVREGLSRGVYEESDGAVVFPGEKYDLHTRVFINSNGLPTYETKDVGLIFSKYRDYNFDKSIVITGNDIIEYMKVVLKSVSMLDGGDILAERTTHITHGNVRLKGNEKMSSRKGNFIKAEDVLRDVAAKLNGNMTLTLGAVKYGFLKYKVGGDIIFDLDECVSTNGNSGIYLLYSVVRAKKIIGAEVSGFGLEVNELDEHERKLIKKISDYEDAVSRAIKELSPNILCNFLYELCQEWSRFYENCKVNGDEREGLRRKIVAAYYKVMVDGLKLIGIDEIPEEM